MERLKKFFEKHYIAISVVIGIMLISSAIYCFIPADNVRITETAVQTERVKNGEKADKATVPVKTSEAEKKAENTDKPKTAEQITDTKESKKSADGEKSKGGEKGGNTEKSETAEKSEAMAQAENSAKTEGKSPSSENAEPAQKNGDGGIQEDESKSYCTFSISCDTINDNISNLKREKRSLVPADGWILQPTRVEIKEGDTVFDVLKRVTRDEGIQMEFNMTPAYGSAYIEGIANLYEFDCGALSGWMYSVNGEFPGYGCSEYELSSGDIAEFKYTCDLGKDVGGYDASK